MNVWVYTYEGPYTSGSLAESALRRRHLMVWHSLDEFVDINQFTNVKGMQLVVSNPNTVLVEIRENQFVQKMGTLHRRTVGAQVTE